MLKVVIVLMSLFLGSCTAIVSKQNANNSAEINSEMQQSTEILGASSQGGSGDISFKILNTQEEFSKAYINANRTLSVISDTPDTPKMKLPLLPIGKKAVLYNLGNFRAGDHTIQEIKNISVKSGVLYVEVPQKQNEGGMEIQVLSQPWVIFTIPSNYKFNSIQLKYSK